MKTLNRNIHHGWNCRKKELQELMITASATEFGKYSRFPEILSHLRKGPKDFYKSFKSRIPIHDYNKIYKDRWKLFGDGSEERNMARPCEIFTLSSGTSKPPLEIHSRYQRHDDGHPPHQREADAVVIEI